MSRLKIISALIISATIISCNDKLSTKPETENLRAIVTKQNLLLENYFKEGDADKVSSLYTDSAKLSPNGGNFVIGRNNIKEFWANDFKSSKLLEMTTHVLTTNGNENVIYETGKTKTKFRMNDSTYNFTVKYINVWVKQNDGSYKLDIDFWNSDQSEKQE